MQPTDSMTLKWHVATDNPMMQGVLQWLADGRTLAWLPIWNTENFPEVPPEVLYRAEQCPQRHCWCIDQVEDFLTIPEGITGWLLPDGDLDTDVVVSLWNDTMHFCSATDRRTGEQQTLQTGRTWEIESVVAEAANQSAV